jgi:SagB-type dehydrogenase family enzyme
LDAGVYRYEPLEHRLVSVNRGDFLRPLADRALGQAAVRRAPCVIVLAADYAVTRRRYGDRGVERYVHMDAGHAAQNVVLQAEALGLGIVTIGAFDDRAVKRLLGIETEPLYLLPVGKTE